MLSVDRTLIIGSRLDVEIGRAVDEGQRTGLYRGDGSVVDRIPASFEQRYRSRLYFERSVRHHAVAEHEICEIRLEYIISAARFVSRIFACVERDVIAAHHTREHGRRIVVILRSVVSL